VVYAHAFIEFVSKHLGYSSSGIVKPAE
jgi:hypothetical protein